MAVSISEPMEALADDAALAVPFYPSLVTEAPSENRRLTGRQAEALWRSWKIAGNSRSRDSLILAYAPMVRYLASRKARELPSHCELDDLISCGLLAIIEAVERFDPAKGATFEQYAWTRVAGSIVDELRRQDRVSRSSQEPRAVGRPDAGQMGRQDRPAGQRARARRGAEDRHHRAA